MTTLTLTVLRCPDAVTPEQRQIHGGELTLGRGAECDWPLADPEKDLSRKHCTLELYAGSWRVRDLSTNGTFVNFGTAPIGRDQPQPLHDGDRLRLGSYEIEVRIAAEARAPGEPLGGSGSVGARIEAPTPRLGGAPLPGLDVPSVRHGARGTPLLPDDFDAASGPDAPMSDHAGAASDAFVPRPVVPTGKPLIPDDWDLEVGSDRRDATVPPQAPPRRPKATAAPATNRDKIPAPLTGPREPSLANNEIPQGRAGARVDGLAVARAPAPPGSAPSTSGGQAAALFALFAGANLSASIAARAAANPDAALRAAGGLLRMGVTGIRALLIARGQVKREFRIEQTMLRATNNNPLKFAATDEQALAALLDPRTPSLRALQESIDDLTIHQVATLAATQAAARTLLEKLAPGPIEEDDKEGGLLPGTREKRLWETYKRRHAKLTAQFEDDFESAYGKAFARAYEQAAARSKD